jgi:histidine triad (HIT) family protein
MKAYQRTHGCLFCRIAVGDVPAHIVHESDRIVAFLDINPIRPGHVQIIPRMHYPYFEDMPADLAGEIVALGQAIATALKAIHGVKRVGFLFTGGDIPHAHAHVVPLVAHDDITSRRYIAEQKVTNRATSRASEEDLAVVADAIRAILSP